MGSEFPYSAVDMRLNFVGDHNSAGRFPNYLSLDLQITKGINLPFFDITMIRIGVAQFDITNNFNPQSCAWQT